MPQTDLGDYFNGHNSPVTSDVIELQRQIDENRERWKASEWALTAAQASATNTAFVVSRHSEQLNDIRRELSKINDRLATQELVTAIIVATLSASFVVNPLYLLYAACILIIVVSYRRSIEHVAIKLWAWVQVWVIDSFADAKDLYTPDVVKPKWMLLHTRSKTDEEEK